MSVTLTEKQWEVVRDAATDYAEEMERLMCGPGCPHRVCRVKEREARAVRKVVDDVARMTEAGRE